MQKSMVGMCLLAALVLLAGCALGDLRDPTPAPPITLPAPPTLMFIGDCERTAELDYWLQTTTYLAQDFVSQLNTAATTPREQLYNQVLRLAQLRDAVNATATPTCAVETQLRLVDAMTTAVSTFQAFANGDLPDLGNVVAEVNAQIDDVMTVQDQLTQQLEQEYQQQRTPVATP